MKLTYINFNKADKNIFFTVFFCSLLLFIFYVNVNASENYGDEAGYIERSQEILKNGFDFVSEKETYPYLAIIAGLRIISNDDIVITKIIISVLQYAVYLGTVIYIANCTVSKNKNKIMWHSIVAFGFLNPFLIQSTTLLLTDVLAACFVVVSIFCLTRIDLTRLKFILFSMAIFYFSVMLRPTSAVFLPIVVGLILFRFLKKKNINLVKVSLISLLILVIFVPQLYQNVTKHDNWTPLTPYPLYEWEIGWASKFMKYGTVIIPGERAQLPYVSPFLPDNLDANIFQVLIENPSLFLFLYFSHIFGVLDWDYVDSYIKEFYPANRIPASLFIYSTWFFVIFGIFSARKNFSAENSFLLKTIIISSILYLAFIATTMVEIRFGFPVFLLLLPFSGYGVKYLYDSCIKHDNKTSKLWVKRLGFTSAYVLFITLFFYISFLFSYQTNRIDWFGFFNL